MKFRVSYRVADMEESATYAVFDLVQSLKRAGTPVLDLGGGEPDFDTPAHISEAAAQSMAEGFTHYTPSRGIPELLAAVSEKLSAENGITTDPLRDIVVTPSAKHALFISLLTVLDPGEEIIIPTPSWVSYASMARLADAVPVLAELDPADGFRLTREVLEAHVTHRTKAVLVNTPNNPTGRVLSEEEAQTLAEFATDHDLFLISDEIYENIRYDGVRHRSPGALPGCAERTLTVNGFSKGHAMTGWRLGYVAGPTEVMAQVLKAQQHTVGCAGSFVQRGGLAALTGPREPAMAMAKEYQARRDLLVPALDAMPGISCTAPEGAFYAFADIRAAGRGSSLEFTQWLLRTAGVAVTPGSAFGPGGEGHVRLSFATSRTVIESALTAMSEALRAR